MGIEICQFFRNFCGRIWVGIFYMIYGRFGKDLDKGAVGGGKLVGLVVYY